MERFFFHIRAGGQLVPDEEGMILPDLAAATAELQASARDLWHSSKGGTVEMTDAKGVILATMPATGPAA